MSSEIHGPLSDPIDPAEGRRLDSWKEIAAFFQRDTRTVRRWEQTRHLPVHRVPGRRGYVFAYVRELNQWLRSADATAAEEEAVDVAAEAEELPESQDAVIPTPPETVFTPASVTAVPVAPQPLIARTVFSRWKLALMVATGLLLVAAGVAAERHRHHQAETAATPAISAQDLSDSTKYTLRGRYYWDRRTEGGLQEALDAFTQAVVHDNNNARAYAGLAETYDLLPEYGKMSNAAAFPRAIAAANRAIALDPSLAEAHRALAFALFYWNWDVNRALTEFHTALQLDPKDFETHHWLATALFSLRRGPEALAEIQRARELRPASRSILADEALINFSFHRDQAESLATLRELERTDPDFVVAPRYLANIFLDEGNYADFIPEQTRAADIAHDANVQAVMQQASIGWKQGGAHAMLLHMKTLQEQQFARGQISAFDVARTCLRLGDKPATLHYLQFAFADHDYMMITILGGDFNDVLKDDPAFRQLQAAIRRRMDQSV